VPVTGSQKNSSLYFSPQVDPMTDPQTQADALDAMIVINAAIRNIRLYPIGSASINKSLDKVQETLQPALSRAGSVEYAESEKQLLVCGEPLSENDLKKPQMTAFIELMLNFAIKGIIFQDGVSQAELTTFLELLSRKPEDIKEEGGLPSLVDRANMPNIAINHKVYITLEEEKSRKSATGPSVSNPDSPGSGAEITGTTPAAHGQGEDYDDKKTKLKGAIASIMKGELRPLLDPMVLRSIPATVTQLVAKQKLKTAQTLIERLGEALLNKNDTIRNGAAQVIVQIGHELAPDQHADLIEKIAEPISASITTTAMGFPQFDNLFSHLASLIQKQIQSGALDSAAQILNPISRQCHGEVPKNLEHFNFINTVATWEIVSHLIDDCHRKDQVQAVEILGLLTPPSTTHLLTILRDSESMHQRNLIIKILPEFGAPALEALRQRFQEKGPWYFTRNLATLLGKMGSLADLPFLKSLLHHKDLRIQWEAINTIYKIGKDQRGQILLEFLPSANDRMKINVVAMLGVLKHSESVPTIISLLRTDVIKDAKSNVRERLLEKCCRALGQIGSQDAVGALSAMVGQNEGPLKTDDAKVLSEAGNALAMIQKTGVRTPGKQSPRAPSPGQLKSDTLVNNAEPAIDFEEGSKEAENLFAKGDTGAAVKLLFYLTCRAAREKNFITAERLREQLMETDAMALTEIIKTGEIIEAEKSEAIDQDHLGVWRELYDTLTSEEVNSLYLAMKEINYEADQVVFEQGDQNPHLYFIHQGALKIVYRQKDREILLHQLGQGDLAGGDTFFSLSVNTVSLVTLSQAKLMVIDKSILDSWETLHPGLKSKLQNFSLVQGKTSDLLEKKGMDRRSQKRFDVKGPIALQLLNESGKPLGKPFKGTLSDLSSGGISFYIRTSKPKTASLLLGRKMNTKFNLSENHSPRTLSETGTVIAVNYHMAGDYSIHIKFNNLLKEEVMAVVSRKKDGPLGMRHQ
jgi:CRP-like cAMP-binding protein/HEAT repeat protein